MPYHTIILSLRLECSQSGSKLKIVAFHLVIDKCNV